MCSGNAPARHKTVITNEIVLGEIDCKPYSATYYTKKLCGEIDFALDQDPTAAGFEQCTCANGSDDWKTSGCCLASGKYDFKDLTAEGCLYQVAGEAGTNYAGKDSDASNDDKPTVDVGRAIQSWTGEEDSATNIQFMCPATGAMIDEHKSFARLEQLAGKSSHETYIHTGNPRIRQGDALHSDAAIYSSKVNGATTGYFPGTGEYIKTQQFLYPNFQKLMFCFLGPHVGLSAAFSDTSISYGHTAKGYVPVYIPEMLSPVMFVEDWAELAIVCDDDMCHKIARLKVASDAFTGTETSKLEGKGMPYDGVQSVGHNQGPSTSGLPR